MGAATAAFLMVAQQVAGKAARDGFFLQTHALAALPRVMTGAAALGLALMVLTSWLLGRLTPRLATPLIFATNAAAFLVEAGLIARQPALAATVTYLHTGAFAGIVASSFWSIMNERFDPHAAKRAFGTINLGATAGGVAGGVLAWQGITVISMAAALTVLAAVSGACAILLLALGRERGGTAGIVAAAAASAARADDAGALDRGLLRQPYLLQLAGLVVLVSAVDTLVEFSFKAAAVERYQPAGGLLPFFALFYACTGAATFALQAGLSRRLLERMGLSGAAAMLPAATLGGVAAALVAPGFWTTLGLRTATLVTENSFYRSGYELAFTPLPPGSKRRLKAYLDVGLTRVAAVAAGALIIGLVALFGPVGVGRIILVLVVLAATASLYLSRALKDGYRGALEESLRSGTVALSPAEIMDADTRQSFGGARHLNREAILAQVAVLAEQDKGGPERDPWRDLRSALRSRTPAVVATALRSLKTVPRELVAELVPLLAMDAVLGDVLTLLRPSVDRHAGALSDALLDPETPPTVRRRLARVLQASSTRLAADGLTEALSDARFEIRLFAGTSLLRLHMRRPDLPLDRARVTIAVRRELEGADARFDGAQLPEAAWLKEQSLFPAGDEGRPGAWWVSHVFNLLALVHDPDVLRLAFAALASQDRRLRGTGLEYLEVLLEADLGARLVALLAQHRQAPPAAAREAGAQARVPDRVDVRVDVGLDVRPEPRRARPQDEVREDLLSSREALAIPADVLARWRSGGSS
jgi:ATP:ADP antiporter, AAA family